MNDTSSWAAFTAVMRRDLMVVMRRRSDVLNPLLFILMVVSLFPLAVGPGPDILGRIAAGVIWVAALLSALLGSERLFRDDFLDGTLEQLTLLPQPLPLLAGAKIVVHWLLSGLPLVILAPLCALLLKLPAEGWLTLMATLVVGTPILSAVTAIGAALTVSLGRGGALLSLLLLPLFIPLLIFATGAVEAALMGTAAWPQVLLLAGLSLLTLLLAPFAVAAAIRVSVN
ncbi:heme exporter protein CcmB [Pseudidiomarina terrestris]|uniref:Heme exporter protein B n=1 Tax=Pseudidiomarina terrestris TaxID=2820060 RepID=A0AAW7QWR5_9GAMM|nr:MULTISPECIES: heme exporter protein CcmB [unclassified Pseudidiomarina]MDN7124612.1 heme exporter protein CcmB [Pseudidiomarina sp. 1APP75-32.1]MDN7126842.1 heme exporter protein CcmB [Pseudidiomarina sp. 1APR75-33.1]MDN7129097.1 heme exporter protein CcmB [Pseudidiomarina sp. 1APR75-15]MDN7134639.1 heme exporter protein CcmB [Pseudidiomarina sp. 1ASP75-5]